MAASAALLDERSNKLASQLATFRHQRELLLTGGIAGEPAWNMLLKLFIDRNAVRHSIRSLARSSHATYSTCYRWIHLLEQRGLVELSPDLRHANRIFVRLARSGETKVRDCLSTLELDPR
jgi:hypothetical protein